MASTTSGALVSLASSVGADSKTVSVVSGALEASAAGSSFSGATAAAPVSYPPSD